MNTKREKIALVGYGMVGKSTAKVLGIPRKDCFDIKDKKKWGYDYYIICLPSPTYYMDGLPPYISYEYRIQNLSIIESWISDIYENDKHAVVILRSTVLPGTTKRLSEEYNLKIVHVPEFLTEKTAYKDEKYPELLIIGSDGNNLGNKIADIFSKKVNPRKIIKTNSSTAELIKYTMNCFFALKVIFGNEIFNVSEQVDANYKIVKVCLESHKWGSKNGWNIFHRGGRGAGGHCLPKDTMAFSQTFNVPLLSKMVEINRILLAKSKK